MTDLTEAKKLIKECEEIATIDNNIVPIKNAKGKWGFKDKRNGKIVIPFQYDAAEDFIAGKAEVILNERWAMIDEKGMEIDIFAKK